MARAAEMVTDLPRLRLRDAVEKALQEIIRDVDLVQWEIRHGRLQRSMAVVAVSSATVSGL